MELPAGEWDTNRRDCFPQWDASPAGTANDGWAIFNKWAVKSITTGDSKLITTGNSFSTQPDVVVEYTYENPGWGFADNPDSNFDTWNEFRGYNKVIADNLGSSAGKTETRFHQGLHGEPKLGSGTQSVSVVRSDGTAIADLYGQRGQVYETRQLTDSNAEISRSWTTYRNVATTSGNAHRLDPRFVAPLTQQARTDGSASTQTDYTYNTWGQVLSVKELGKVGTTDSTGDERTTVTRYYQPTTSTDLGDWRGTFPCVTATREGTSISAPLSGNASGFVRWSQTFYDNDTGTSCNHEIDEPVIRRTAVAHTGTGRLTTVFGTDDSGRVTSITDPNGNITTTTYDDDHGQITQVTQVTNPENWVAETVYDDWRRPIEVIDINDRSSYTFYDEYSRVTAVREPQDASENRDTIRVTYNQDAQPSTVQTETRINGSTYTKQVSFYDGFGRNVLNRSLAPDVGDNYATAVQYDNAGRMRRQSATYTISNDNINTFAYPNWNTVPSFTQTEYDHASRPTDSDLRKGTGGSDVLFTTSTEYNGFTTRFRDQRNLWTDTTINGLGYTTQIREQLNSITTSYDNNAAGDLLEVTAPDGFKTTITYDLAGRKLTSDDPDSGDWEYGYDANSNLISQEDPSGDVSAITYDNLDRRTEIRVDGDLRGRWFYDPAGNLGLLWDSRHFKPRDGGGADLGTVYQTQEFDQWGRLVKDQTEIPDHASGNPVRLRFATEYTLRDDGQPSTISHPDGTNAETGYNVNYTYNSLSLIHI